VANKPTAIIDPSGLFGEWYDGAPLGANLVLFFTPKFLDNPRTVRKTRARLAGFGSGILLACVAPVAAGVASVGYGINKLVGGPGNDFLDGAAVGAGVGRLGGAGSGGSAVGGMLKPPLGGPL